MAFNMSATVLLPLLVLVLFAAGAQADASEFSPPMARRAGPLPPPPPATAMFIEEGNCPLIQVPSVKNACLISPGLAVCVSQCQHAGHRGGHCDILPNGIPGDCTCLDCLGDQA